MDISLINKAREIARQQKSDEAHAQEKHLEEIYNEVIRLLEENILNKRIYKGCIDIRTSDLYIDRYDTSETDRFEHGYCGWNSKIDVLPSEGEELLDFAPNDKRTIDYCAYLIKSRKTIFNEVNEAIRVGSKEGKLKIKL